MKLYQSKSSNFSIICFNLQKPKKKSWKYAGVVLSGAEFQSFWRIFYHRLFSMQMSPHGRNTVQGTFDDLSDEEKTRAYLQFLQYHQQLEQKNETKRFQEMLNHGEKTITQANSNSDNTVPTNDSLRIWYGLKNRGHSCSSSLSMSSLMIMILMVFYHMLP